MANPHRGEVELVVDDARYTLRLATNAIAEAEALLDMGVGEIADMLSNAATFRLGTARVLLWAGLREHHPGLSLDDAGEIIGTLGIGEVIDVLGKSMQAAFPSVKEGAERPPKASPGGTGKKS